MQENLYARLVESEGTIENNACVPVALHLAHPNLSYQDAIYYMAAHGRRKNCGVHAPKFLPAFKKAGLILTTHNMRELNQRGITIREALAITKHYEHGAFLFFRDHIAFAKDGKIHDWRGEKNRHRVLTIYEISYAPYDVSYVEQKIEEGRKHYVSSGSKKTIIMRLAEKYGWEEVEERRFSSYGSVYYYWYLTQDNVRYVIMNIESRRNLKQVMEWCNGSIRKAMEIKRLVQGTERNGRYWLHFMNYG